MAHTTKTYKDGETLDEAESLAVSIRRCPDCGSGVVDGPSGGGSQNLICTGFRCGSKFNLSALTYQRISDMSPNLAKKEEERRIEGFDPINDEKKEFTLKEFIEAARNELALYEKTWTDGNEFHRDKHTWKDWWSSFHGYMSW